MIQLTLMNGTAVSINKSLIVSIVEVFNGSKFWFTEVTLKSGVICVRETSAEITEKIKE